MMERPKGPQPDTTVGKGGLLTVGETVFPGTSIPVTYPIPNGQLSKQVYKEHYKE